MDLTRSFETWAPESVRSRYTFFEVRNATAIFAATDPELFSEFVAALDEFEILRLDLTTPGGQETQLAKRFNRAFRRRGWREARVDTDIDLRLRVMPYRPDGETNAIVRTTSVSNPGYKVDNYKNRVALDLEWNAKDGNLDRDIGAYRALYDTGMIDVAVLVTRTQAELREHATRLRMDDGIPEEEARRFLGTTTTTNIDKLLPRLTRGDAGGCPILAVAIGTSTYENSPQPYDAPLPPDEDLPGDDPED
jgi:hypothetical protein